MKKGDGGTIHQRLGAFVRPNRAGASVPEAFGLSAVVEIAKAIGTRLSKPVNTAAVSKIKDTPELKDVFDYRQRIKLLQGAFNVDRDAVAAGKNCTTRPG